MHRPRRWSWRGRVNSKRRSSRCAAFLKNLCEVRVLDPACGSGNFLYVTLEHLKRLEGEVLNQLDDLGDTQGRLELTGRIGRSAPVARHRTQSARCRQSPRWCCGSAICNGTSARAARSCRREPVLKDFHNIECRDAVLAYDRVEFVNRRAWRTGYALGWQNLQRTSMSLAKRCPTRRRACRWSVTLTRARLNGRRRIS